VKLIGLSVLLAVSMCAVRHGECVSNTYASVQDDLNQHNCAELGEEKVVNILF
jgi:hypothetical protein